MVRHKTPVYGESGYNALFSHCRVIAFKMMHYELYNIMRYRHTSVKYTIVWRIFLFVFYILCLLLLFPCFCPSLAAIGIFSK